MTSPGEGGVDGPRHGHDVPAPVGRRSREAEEMGARACIERQKRLRGGHAAARLQLPPLGRKSEPRRNGGPEFVSLEPSKSC